MNTKVFFISIKLFSFPRDELSLVGLHFRWWGNFNKKKLVDFGRKGGCLNPIKVLESRKSDIYVNIKTDLKQQEINLKELTSHRSTFTKTDIKREIRKVSIFFFLFFILILVGI